MTLTRREKEILRRVLRGQKRSAIADELKISVHTVHFHLDNVKGKFRAATLIQAAIRFVTSQSS